MLIVSVGIGLPQFDHRIWDGNAVSIEHSKGEPNALALCSLTGDAANTSCIREPKVEERPGGL
jgi:hypothetical protein